MPAWTGPPRSLIVATVVALGLATVLGWTQDDAPPAAGDDRASLTSATTGSEQEPPDAGVTSPRILQEPSTPQAPGAPAVEPRTVGVVTLNQSRRLTRARLDEDARRLLRDDGADIIGWQEAWHSARVLDDLRDLGWTTRRFPRGARELAVSWRTEDFAFVGAEQRQVAKGVDPPEGAAGPDGARDPFGDRWAVRVTLRDLASGRRVSVLNTHLPWGTVEPDDRGRATLTRASERAGARSTRLARMWGQAPGRWVVGTGDYSVDAGADRPRPEQGVSRVLARRAVSSYTALGLRDLGATHPASGRHVDYVHVAQRTLERDLAAFVSHRVVAGLGSDHRALLVRLRLS